MAGAGKVLARGRDMFGWSFFFCTYLYMTYIDTSRKLLEMRRGKHLTGGMSGDIFDWNHNSSEVNNKIPAAMLIHTVPC